MEFTIRKILLYSPFLICILFSFLLLTLNKKNKPSKFLAISLLGTAIQFILVAFQDFGGVALHAIAYSTTYAVIISSAPLLFFYYKKLIIPNYRFSGNELFHFIPSLIYLALHVFIFLNISSETLQLIYNKEFSSIHDGLFTLYNKSCVYHRKIYFIQVYAYGIYFLYLLYNHKKRIGNYFSFTEKISLNWLLIYTIVYLLFTTAELLLSKSFPGKDPTLYFIIINIYFLFIGYFGLKQNEIYTQSIANENLDQNLTEPTNNIPCDNEKLNTVSDSERLILQADLDEVVKDSFTHKSNLSKDFKECLYSQLVNYINKERPFLKPELSIDDLAKNLNTNRNYISIVINEKFKDNFFNFINYYRVNEIICMLNNEKYSNFTLEGLAQTVGFKSRATFNPAFKKYTGKTPSEYKKMLVSEK